MAGGPAQPHHPQPSLPASGAFSDAGSGSGAVSGPEPQPQTGAKPASDVRTDWHAQSAEQVLQTLGVDPTQGLSPDAVVQRLRTHGHNRLPTVRGLPA